MKSLAEIPLGKREFDAFRELIFKYAGISLADSKHSLVQSRLAKRLRYHGLDSYREYLELLQDERNSSEERECFVNCMTTNKTEFFRESHHFEFLREVLFPEIIAEANNGGERKVRIWCAASSTGEEPYTLAMSMREHFSGLQGWDLRILASDIDTEVLNKASEGRYSGLAVDYLPDEMRRKYFREDGNQIVAKDELRQLITFRQLNLVDSSFPINTQFDAVFCRNVMIYFQRETQKKVVENLSKYVRPNRYLIIGHSESLIGFSDRLESLGNTIYRVKDDSLGDSKPFASLSKSSSSIPRLSNTSRSSKRQTTVGSVVNVKREQEALSSSRASTLQQIDFRGGESKSNAVPEGDVPTEPIIVGQYYGASRPCRVRTTLGSCVAACLYDPQARIGGMNHFMLPESSLPNIVCASYGIHAMELLINRLLSLGAKRDRMVAKVFGGANVMGGASTVWNVGDRNSEFIRQFLAKEQIPIVAERLGGTSGVHLQFETHTGKVLLRILDDDSSKRVVLEQLKIAVKEVEELKNANQKCSTLFVEESHSHEQS